MLFASPLLFAAFSPALSPSLARAQAGDEAAARALFNEGRTLVRAGHVADGCSKLEAASRLYRSAGIFLNLADCHEKLGRTASAWTEFGDAAAIAERTNREAESKEAHRRQNALEPKLARLTVRVARAVPGLRVTSDGSELASAAWGSAIPVDPGPHQIHAEADGYQPWTGNVEAKGAGETVFADVPELSAVPPAPVAPIPPRAELTTTSLAAPSSASESSSHSSPVLEVALIGGGAAVAIAGGVLMLVEAGKASDARTSHDTTEYDSAKGAYVAGVVGLAAGGAAAALGVILLATRGDGTPRSTGRATVTPWVDRSAGGFQVEAIW